MNINLIGDRMLIVLVSLLVTSPVQSQRPQAPAGIAPVGSERGIEGSYRDDTGAMIAVRVGEAGATLQSGPSTFALKPEGPGRYAVPERNLTVTFDGDRLTIREAGRIVAKAVRGAVPVPPPAYQGPALATWLDATMPSLLARYHVPAAAIGYVDHGRVMWTRTYGESRRGVVTDAHTLFNVASLTKPITAEVVMRLVSQGTLALDAPMTPAYVDPDLAGDARADRLTLRMALQHRTGLPNWRAQTANVLRFVAEPGTQFHYSGEGYTYAARYAEKATGVPFEELARREVFEPLGMNETHYVFSPDYRTRAARPHDAQGHEIWPTLRLEYSGACCLFTTIGDYSKLLAAVMDDRALRPVVRDERFRRDPARKDELCVGDDGLPAAICPPYAALGLGWFVFGFPGETVVNHTGTNEGERSAAFFVPEKGIGLVVLTNGANGARIVRDVTHAAYDNPAYLRVVDHFAE